MATVAYWLLIVTLKQVGHAKVKRILTCPEVARQTPNDGQPLLCCDGGQSLISSSHLRLAAAGLSL